MPDRSWERGLHQLIEIKEGCEMSRHRESLAQITYQRYFRRYMRLSGMTGTAREVAGELCAVYGVRTHRIPTNRPSRRTSLGATFFRSAEDKWHAVVTAAERQAAAGRPVLIGTRSVAASEIVSSLLQERGSEHVVLNARQDHAEAEAVAAAGQAARITVATNMAGRGTDIVLGDGIAERGGLHVILTEFHESARIDRQLVGRAGRQGDPGSFEAIASLEDELFTRFAPRMTRSLATRFGQRIPARLGLVLRRLAQAAAERYNGRIRRQVVRRDQELDRAFAFAGQPD
jgi:preprotein translocase subunit SecA